MNTKSSPLIRWSQTLLLCGAAVFIGSCCPKPQPLPPDNGPPPPKARIEPAIVNEWVAAFARTEQAPTCPATADCTGTLITQDSSRVFCSYTCKSSEPFRHEKALDVSMSSPALVPLAAAHLECSTPTPAVPDLGAVLLPALQERVSGRIAGTNTPASLLNSLRAVSTKDGARATEETAEVYVVDTAALDFARSGVAPEALERSPHGRQVGLTAQLAACGNQVDNCPVQIVNAPGLAVVATRFKDESNVNSPLLVCRDGNPLSPCEPVNPYAGSIPMGDPRLHGGFFAFRSDLAVAIEKVVARLLANSNPRRAVINLSVGWHSKHDCPRCSGASCSKSPGCSADLGDDTPSVPQFPQPGRYNKGLAPLRGLPALRNLESEAVFTAIVRARCLGAIVVAAAGNAVDEDRTGPLLPAGWEQYGMNPQTLETPIECSEFVEGVEGPIKGQLIYSAAGTDFLDGLVPNARIGALPRFVAHGESVNVRDADPRSPTVALTGSSMAAAVVSGAAARLWAENPQLDAALVMEKLYSAGRDLSTVVGSTTLCPGQVAGGAISPGTCTQPPHYIGCSGAGCQGRPQVSRDALVALGFPVGSQPPSGPSVPTCKLIVDAQTPACDDDKCGTSPEAFSTLDAPWAAPQPNPPVECATCTAVFDKNWVYLNQKFNWNVASAQLRARIKTSAGESWYVLSVNSLINPANKQFVSGFVQLPSGATISTNHASRLTVVRQTVNTSLIADLNFTAYDLL